MAIVSGQYLHWITCDVRIRHLRHDSDNGKMQNERQRFHFTLSRSFH